MKRNQDLYDVVIVGSGAGGIGAAYALLNSGLRILLVDQNSILGGTHVNAWVNVMATTPPAPFERGIFEDLEKKGYAMYLDPDYNEFSPQELRNITFEDTYMEQRFLKKGREVSVCYDVEELAKKYAADLQSKIEILLNTKLISVSKDGNKVRSVVLRGLNAREIEIPASLFIDSTGDGLLCRLAGTAYYLGEDSKTTYDDYCFIEPSAPIVPEKNVNVPTLMYKIEKGTENLSHIEAKFSFDSLIYNNPGGAFSLVNTVFYLEEPGISVLEKGVEAVYSEMIPRTLQHWKKAKNVANIHPRYKNYNLDEKCYAGVAPMLGIRETYRIKCRRMLNELALSKLVTPSNIMSLSDPLDSIIAIGNHTVDIHGKSNINQANIERVPYGVPYGCIIPLGLDNVFVACRASGFTHIAAASFRLTRNIMQIGYAAGKACQYMFDVEECNLTDQVDVNMLQKKQYMDFQIQTSMVYEMIDDKYRSCPVKVDK